jgi:sortase A
VKPDPAWGAECAWPAAQPAPERGSSWPWKSLGLALLLIGALQFGHGAWIRAKVWLAQELIAHAWSRTLKGETQVKPWPWADTWPVARLSAPNLGIDRYVLASANGSAIAFGPGHLSGTPVPGEPGNSVIGGHRDTHLAFLKNVKPGDELLVERADGTRIAYRVRDALVLDKRDVWVAKQEGPSRLTLVTCFPFDALRAGGAQRYVVFAFESRNRGGERGTRG